MANYCDRALCTMHNCNLQGIPAEWWLHALAVAIYHGTGNCQLGTHTERVEKKERETDRS